MADNSAMLEAFGELAPHYEETMDRELGAFLGLGYQEFVSYFVKQNDIGPDDLVLDVATGTALIPRTLVDEVGAGKGIVGLDITPAMLQQARQRVTARSAYDRVHLVCASATVMPFGASVFDVVICGFGTHHMDVPHMLSEMQRVLKPGGKLILADAGLPAFWRWAWWEALLQIVLQGYRLVSRGARARVEADAIHNIRTAAEWQAVLSGTGFTGIQISESRTRRPWYPRALTIRAVANGARPRMEKEKQ
jgi:ubiquinone/menaquinone biosynthesis C-methylase UbiE